MPDVANGLNKKMMFLQEFAVSGGLLLLGPCWLAYAYLLAAAPKTTAWLLAAAHDCGTLWAAL